MIVSRNWLAEYVQLDMPMEELTHRLTMSGLNLESVHQLDGDVAIDLEVTSNRPDCLGHLGVAREISVLFEKSLKIPAADPAQSRESASNATSVSVQCPDLCHEYHARVIQGVKIGPSPEWLVKRLQTAFLRENEDGTVESTYTSINNVADITNYVMLECGQPLHAFDFDKLSGNQVVVRRSKAGESITAIDQKKYDFADGTCVIADAVKPVAIAGVMGGYESEISDQTVNVLIEAASFDPISVRTTARALKLHSPSSFRFERRVDRQRLDWASRRCCELILQIAGGQLLEGVVTGGDPPAAHNSVCLRFEKVSRLLGMSVLPQECVDILERLGVQCLTQSQSSATFAVPSWRLDLTRECDLIEEIARIHGYDRIPDDAPLPVVSTTRSRREMVGDAIRSHLTALGFFEALTLSFISQDQQDLFRPRGGLPSVAVNHSTRSHENQMRQSLVPSLLQCRRQNERHGTLNAELFEVAKVYLSAGQGQPEQAAEPVMVSLVSGRDFSAVKGIVESLLAQIVPSAVLTAAPSSLPEFAADRGAELFLNNQPLGWIGELKRSIADQLKLQDAPMVAELNVNLLEDLFESNRVHTPVARFPSVSRDLNFVLPEAVTWAQLSAVVSASVTDLLTEVSFAGQYRGQQIAAGSKSYVVTCRFAAEDRTLTAEEVDSRVQQILAGCEKELEAKLR